EAADSNQTMNYADPPPGEWAGAIWKVDLRTGQETIVTYADKLTSLVYGPYIAGGENYKTDLTLVHFGNIGDMVVEPSGNILVLNDGGNHVVSPNIPDYLGSVIRVDPDPTILNRDASDGLQRNQTVVAYADVNSLNLGKGETSLTVGTGPSGERIYVSSGYNGTTPPGAVVALDPDPNNNNQ